MTVVSVELTPPESSPVQYLAATPSFQVGVGRSRTLTIHFTGNLIRRGEGANQGVFIGASSVEVVSSRRKSLSSWSNSENLCGSCSLAMSAQRESMRSRLSDVIGWLRFPSRPVLMALLAALTCLCADFPIVLQPLLKWAMSLQAGTAATIFLTTRTGIFSK